MQPRRAGLGLLGMRERDALVRGNLELEAKSSEGKTVVPRIASRRGVSQLLFQVIVLHANGIALISAYRSQREKPP